jgi:hypothetical protein
MRSRIEEGGLEIPTIEVRGLDNIILSESKRGKFV